MIQYMSTLPIIIRTKTGEIRKINEPRKRVRYSLDSIFLDKVMYNEKLRLDLMSNRVYNNIFFIEYLIDVNDVDLLSKNIGDELRFTTAHGYR